MYSSLLVVCFLFFRSLAVGNENTGDSHSSAATESTQETQSPIVDPNSKATMRIKNNNIKNEERRTMIEIFKNDLSLFHDEKTFDKGILHWKSLVTDNTIIEINERKWVGKNESLAYFDWLQTGLSQSFLSLSLSLSLFFYLWVCVSLLFLMRFQ